MTYRKSRHVVVVGAGAFGGWSALQLLRAGARVTLLEMRDAGNPLSSSGGESRVIRHVYEQRRYVEMAQRALALWTDADQRWQQNLLHRKGVLFMSAGGPFMDAAASHMQACGVNFERLDSSALALRYPQINGDDFELAFFEPDAGYLDARRACVAVRDAFIAEGGSYRQIMAQPGLITGNEMQGLALPDGEQLQGDEYLFACGPWLKTLFPALLAPLLRISRQEVYFFATPRDQVQALNLGLPVWADVGDSLWYGIPGKDGLFKLADDAKGLEVDPETQDRRPSAAGIDKARRYLNHRFPGMKAAPLVDSRVCQYSETPDADFILDRHPQAQNVWLLGGGSGHGFKHGPALGELAAEVLLGKRQTLPEFRLNRGRQGFSQSAG